MLKRAIIFYLSVMMSFFIAGCKDKIQPGNTGEKSVKKINTPVGIAEIKTYPLLYEAVGTITAGTTSLISGKVFGAIRKIYVHEGTQVKKGDLIAEIDDRQADAQFKKAMAGLAEAKKALASAKASRDAAKTAAGFAGITFQRYKKLLKQSSVSPQEFDGIRAKYKQAKAALISSMAMIEAAQSRINQARAGVAAANLHKKDAVVKAPYSGTITKKNIAVGDLSSPGTPLFSLETRQAFQVTFSVPEIHIDQVHMGQKLMVKIPSMGNIRVVGSVVRIDPAADPLSRSFKVKVSLPETHKFRSGVFVRTSLPVGITDMILLPETAIIHKGQLTGVYLVDDKKTAHFRLIRTGRIINHSAEVISGIHSGDHYVINPPVNMENNVLMGVKS